MTLGLFLDTLSSLTKFRLQNASSPLRNVAVLEERKGFVAQDVVNALTIFNSAPGSTLTGACVIIQQPRVMENRTQGPQGQLWCKLVVRIHEVPMINNGVGGTGLSAAVIMEHVLNLIHTWSADTLGHELNMRQVPEVTNDTTDSGEVIKITEFELLAPPLRYSNCGAPVITVGQYDGGLGGWPVSGVSGTAGALVRILIIGENDTLVLDPDFAGWVESPALITAPGVWRVLAVATKAGMQMSALVDQLVSVTQPALQFVEGGDMNFVEGGAIGEL